MTSSNPASAKQQTAPHELSSAAGEPVVTGSDADSTQQLISLLEQQCHIYQQLQDLGRTQGELVNSGASEPLLRVLASRQKLIDELARLNSEMEPYRAQWPQVFGSLSESKREQVASLVKQVEQMLATIIDQDNRDRKQLEDAKGQIGNELSRVAHAGTAIDAYKVQRPVGNPGRSGLSSMTDRRG